MYLSLCWCSFWIRVFLFVLQGRTWSLSISRDRSMHTRQGGYGNFHSTASSICIVTNYKRSIAHTSSIDVWCTNLRGSWCVIDVNGWFPTRTGGIDILGTKPTHPSATNEQDDYEWLMHLCFLFNVYIPQAFNVCFRITLVFTSVFTVKCYRLCEQMRTCVWAVAYLSYLCCVGYIKQWCPHLLYPEAFADHLAGDRSLISFLDCLRHGCVTRYARASRAIVTAVLSDGRLFLVFSRRLAWCIRVARTLFLGLRGWGKSRHWKFCSH